MSSDAHHPKCDGHQCEIPTGPVAWFPLEDDLGRVKLCKRCWGAWNHNQRAKQAAAINAGMLPEEARARYPEHSWDTAETYWP